VADDWDMVEAAGIHTPFRTTDFLSQRRTKATDCVRREDTPMGRPMKANRPIRPVLYKAVAL
jgi:hypothetical protein